MVYGVVLPYRVGFDQPDFPRPIGQVLDSVLEPFLLVELLARFRTAVITTHRGVCAVIALPCCTRARVLHTGSRLPFVRGGSRQQRAHHAGESKVISSSGEIAREFFRSKARAVLLIFTAIPTILLTTLLRSVARRLGPTIHTRVKH